MSPPPDAGADAVVGDASRRDSSLEPLDATLPSPYPGWDHYADYDPSCGFYVPSSRASMPEPFAWQPCRVTPQTAGTSCREMVTDWKPSKYHPNSLITPGTGAMMLADGRPALVTARFEEETTFRIVAPLDGPVLIAIREDNPLRCVLGGEPGDQGHYAFHVFDSEAEGSISERGGGAIGGSVDELRPKLLRHYRDRFYRFYAAGSPGIVNVTGGPLVLSPWDDVTKMEELGAPPEDNALSYNLVFFHQDTLFWSANRGMFSKQKVWTRASGVKDFLSFGSDTSKAAGDLGTDGKDLVWLEAANPSKDALVYTSVSVVTSPFTNDPTKIQRRVLRTDLGGYSFGISPFRVGCGYAVRGGYVVAGGELRNVSMIIRLADGAAWFLPAQGGDEWIWAQPLGVTCDEAVVLVNLRPSDGGVNTTTVARVRLDSLGPPIPP